MQIAACSRSSFASNSASLTLTVMKHHMQMLSVSERRVNSGLDLLDGVLMKKLEGRLSLPARRRESQGRIERCAEPRL